LVGLQQRVLKVIQAWQPLAGLVHRDNVTLLLLTHDKTGRQWQPYVETSPYRRLHNLSSPEKAKISTSVKADPHHNQN